MCVHFFKYIDLFLLNMCFSSYFKFFFIIWRFLYKRLLYILDKYSNLYKCDPMPNMGESLECSEQNVMTIENI